MPYSPQTWIDNNSSYPLSAARMNNVETGIQSAASVADQGHRILTTAQRDALGSVTAGTMIYNSTLTRVQVYYDGAWVDGDTFRTVGSNKVNNVIVPPMCRLVRTTTQAIVTGTDTIIAMGAAEIDTDGMATTGASSRITIQTAGVYAVSYEVRFDSVAATFTRSAYVGKNGTAVRPLYLIQSPTTGPIYFSGSFIMSLAAADYLVPYVWHDRGSDVPVTVNFGYAASLSAVWVGKTS